MGVLRLSLGFEVLHGPKNDQKPMQYHYGYIKFNDRVDGMNMFCFVPRVLHSKNVNAIHSSCIYKQFQNSNYEIGDCFYDEGIAQNHAFRL